MNPNTPAIAFFWATPLLEDSFSIPRCSSLRLLTTANPGSSVQPVAPFFFTVAPTGAVVSLGRVLVKSEKGADALERSQRFNWSLRAWGARSAGLPTLQW